MAPRLCHANQAIFRPCGQLPVLNVPRALRVVLPASRKTELPAHSALLQSKGRLFVSFAQLVITAMIQKRILESYAHRERIQVRGRVLAACVNLVSFVLMVKLKHVRLERFPWHNRLRFQIACRVHSVRLLLKVRPPVASNVQLGTHVSTPAKHIHVRQVHIRWVALIYAMNARLGTTVRMHH
jgi:hypothetical protein